MYYVYVLKSVNEKRVYVGFTADLKNRLSLHNSGRIRSTKSHIPWKLIYYEAYLAKSDATRREKELKLHAAKNALLKRLKFSLKSLDAVAK